MLLIQLNSLKYNAGEPLLDKEYFASPITVPKAHLHHQCHRGVQPAAEEGHQDKDGVPHRDSLFKILFLAMKDITAKWYGKHTTGGLIISQLMISFPDRISDEDFI